MRLHRIAAIALLVQLLAGYGAASDRLCHRKDLHACAGHGWRVVDSVFGDLNRDGISDIVIQVDSLDSTNEAVVSDIDQGVLVFFGNKDGSLLFQKRFGFPCTGCMGASGWGGIKEVRKGRLVAEFVRGSNCRVGSELEIVWTGRDWRMVRKASRTYCNLPREVPCPGRKPKSGDREHVIIDFDDPEGSCYEEETSVQDFARLRETVDKYTYLWKAEEPELLKRERTTTDLPDSLALVGDYLSDE